MSYHDETHLDGSLKNINSDIIWEAERQKRMRNNFLSKLEEEHQKQSFKWNQWLKRSAIPILATLLFFGTLTTIFLGEFSKQQSAVNDNPVQNPMASGDNHPNFSIFIDEETNSEIETVKESGFDLRLPGYSPKADTEAGRVVKRPARDGTHVSVPFSWQGEELFHFQQESIIKEDKDYIEQRERQIKEEATDQVELSGGVPAYYTEKEASNGSKLLSLNIITENYSFLIYSYNLSKDEIIKIGGSLDLTGLD